jgi:POT family proton-dependent oligopeptide transporter
MVISLLTFLIGKRQLGKIGEMPAISLLYRSKAVQVAFYLVMAVVICLLIVLFQILFHYPKEADLILIFASLAILLAVLFFLFKEPAQQRKKLIACLILILISVGFWAFYNQTYTSLMLFADRNMSKQFLGITIDAEFTQFFNPFFIILLSPILSRLWVRLDAKGEDPSTPMKFSLGILFMAIGFLILGAGTRYFSVDGEASPWWLVTSYFLETIGELLLSPIGLAMVTKLSPRHLVGMMMGVWFLTQSAAFAIGGSLATLSDVPKGVGGSMSLMIYTHAFLVYGVVSLAIAALSFALVPYLKRLIGTPHEPTPTPKQ